MEPLATDQIRAAFVNGSKGDAKRMNLPSLASVPWGSLDFLGWRDPQSPLAGGMALWRDGEPLSIMLRATPRPASNKQGMCSFCHTFHSASDVAFMGAAKAGAKGRDGNTVAAAMCADLACSLYARQLRKPARVQPQETIDVQTRVWRLQINLEQFVAKVLDMG